MIESKVFYDRTEWYLNGQKHREDGPSYESFVGDKYWYLNDIEYTEEEYNKKINSKNA